MTTALLKRLLLNGAKKKLPTIMEKSKNLLKKYGREALKRLKTKVKQKANQYKDKNFATKCIRRCSSSNGR